MATKKEQVIKALKLMRSRRYSYSGIDNYMLATYHVGASRSHLCRIESGEREAKPKLAEAILKAAKVLK